MKTRLLHASVGLLLLAAANAHAAIVTIQQTAATLTFDDSQTFGTFNGGFEFGFFPTGFGGQFTFNTIPQLEIASGRQELQSAITVTITANPGYGLTNVGFGDNGFWSTLNPATVDAVGQASLVNAVTGDPVDFFGDATAHMAGQTIGTLLSGGYWYFSGTTPYGAVVPPSVRMTLSRTLIADASAGGVALIGNQTINGGGGGGLNISYSAEFIGSPVPEPEAVVLLALGLAALALAMRRRARRT
jgi:hypothetical protein